MKRKRKMQYAVAAASVVVLAALGFIGLTGSTAKSGEGANDTPATKAVVYRSPTCGCCGNYVSYLERNGFDVETKFVEASGRADLGVQPELGSCHTTVVEGYAVEGHVPVEAINDLLEKRPVVKGIGMPGMPSGSPGMPGAKIGKFVISSFTESGEVSLFVEL